MKILKDFKISAWAGGITKEIYIFPETSTYKKKDFIYRISKATLPEEISQFTSLESVHRILLLLEGNTKLSINGDESILNPGDQKSFEGADITRSQGKAVDFNLMLREGAKGYLKYYLVLKGEEYSIENDANYHLCFIQKGKFQLIYREKKVLIDSETLIILDEQEQMELHAEQETGIFVEIKINLI